MRRAVAGAACAVVLLMAGCDAGREPATSQRPDVERASAAVQQAGSVCDLVRPTLTGEWKVGGGVSATYPVTDACSLTDSADPNHRFDISVGVLALTAPDIAALRSNETRSLKSLGYAAEPVAATVGQGSWTVSPAAAGPWIVFFTGGRSVKVARASWAEGQLEAVIAVARTIAALPGGLPAAPAVQARPECDRGTAAAEKILGGRAVARRDAIVDGGLKCHWGSSKAGVVSLGGGPGSEPATDFTMVKSAGTPSSATGSHRVDLGDEAWQQKNGFLAYRAGTNVFVTIRSVPMAAKQSAAVVALGRATIPIYNR